MPDYQLGKIYKIEPICDHEEHEIYIGSTTKTHLSKRMIKHRSDYKRQEKLDGKYTVFNIFDKCGVENCKIFLLENYPCNSRDELTAKEGEYIKNMKCINKCIAGRTHIEYIKDNKDMISNQRKQYYKNNKEYFSEYHKEHYQNNKEKRRQDIVTCLCGCEIRKDGLNKHQTTKKHNDLMKEKQQDK